MVGEYSKYTAVTATPVSTGNSIEFSNPLGVVPKLVIVEGDAATGCLSYIIMANGIGASFATDETDLGTTYQYYNGDGTTVKTFALSASAILIARRTATTKFDPSIIYTAHIYA